MYERGLYPYTKRYLPHFRNHFSTIGVNGINEMIVNYSQQQDSITTETGIEFAAEILDYIRNRMKEFQAETGNLYNLEATPAEGTTYRFAKEDKKRYPDIIQAGFDENIYYTNSSRFLTSQRGITGARKSTARVRRSGVCVMSAEIISLSSTPACAQSAPLPKANPTSS